MRYNSGGGKIARKGNRCITEPVKGNAKVMPREIKKPTGQSQAGQQANELPRRTISRSNKEHETQRP